MKTRARKIVLTFKEKLPKPCQKYVRNPDFLPLSLGKLASVLFYADTYSQPKLIVVKFLFVCKLYDSKSPSNSHME